MDDPLHPRLDHGRHVRPIVDVALGLGADVRTAEQLESDLFFERERRKEAERVLAGFREALEEVHEFDCGCDRPGNPSACVAQPVTAFTVLAAAAGQGSEI